MFAEAFTKAEIVYLPVEKVMPNPYQPRKFFEKRQLQDLADSIREYGVIQPISVRLINGAYYELVAGERRLRASIMAGMSSIPAIIINISDQDSAIIAIVENLQRQDLNYIEEAEGLRNLIDDYGFTQEQVAEKVGKKQSTIANKLRILRLSEEIRGALLENELTERHARALLRLPDEEAQRAMIGTIMAGFLNVKQTEDAIDRVLSPEQAPPRKKGANVKYFVRDIRVFKNTIKEAVSILEKSGFDASLDFEEHDDGCFVSIAVSY